MIDLTPAQRAGRALMIDLAGEALLDSERTLIQQLHIRAFCLFRRNVHNQTQTLKLIAELRQLVGAELLLAVDQEGGAVMRTLFLPQAPSAMALGAANSEALAEAVGAAVARGLASLGIHWNFAPVVDLNCNPRNPVIAERSFGENPERVVALAGAWLRGHISQGVATCLKHFPGHGDTHLDSHRALPVVDKPLAELAEYEWLPFQQLQSSSPAIMSAHIVFPALDPLQPATLSQPILTGLLREQWGFQGVIITDGMNMQAIRDSVGQATGSVLALQAGADLSLVLMHPAEMLAAHSAIVSAIENGSLPLSRISAANQRVDAFVQQFSGETKPYSAAQEAADRQLMQQAWQAGLTLTKTELARQAIPPALGSKVRLIMQADAPPDGVSEAGIRAETLIDALRPLYQLDVVLYQQRDALIWANLPQDDCFTLLVSSTRQRYAAAQCQTWRPDLHLCLWNPYVCLDIAAPAVVSYGFTPPAIAAVVEFLSERSPANGALPFSTYQ